MKRLLAMLLAGILCVACLTACGNSEEGSAGSSKDEVSSEEVSSETSVDTEENVLVVGTNAAFPPFEYVGDDGQPDGFDIALIKAIGEELGMEVEIQDMEFDALVMAIGSKIDAAIAGMTIDEDRLRVVDFSDPYYDAIQYVIVAKDSTIATAADLENKTIGVQLGTTGNYTADEIPGATVQTYNKGVDAVTDLRNGRLDAVIIDKNPALVFTEKYPDELVALDGAQFEFATEQYAIALPKGSDLVKKVNDALAELKSNGTFDTLVAQYIEAAE